MIHKTEFKFHGHFARNIQDKIGEYVRSIIAINLEGSNHYRVLLLIKESLNDHPH